MRELHFKDYFWNSELTSTVGYDAIIQHLGDGRRTCKEVEDFLKARASIEERYAKELLGLSKKVCGHSEMKVNAFGLNLHRGVVQSDKGCSTLKRSLDMFKLQTEHVSLSHLQLSQTMREEVRKLEEFRERQKEAKKQVEQHMDAMHKQRATQFKKTMESKKTYDQKCRDKEEMEQNMNRNASTTNSKQLEKLYAKTQQAKQSAEEADRMYMQNVTALQKTKDDWQKEHVRSCEVFEKMEVERINTLRNVVWTHLNHLSQQCVTSDELYEEVRKSLEQCNIQEDIGHFVTLRQTGEKPPAPVLYENFYCSSRPTVAAPPPSQPPPITRRRALPQPPANQSDTAYSTIQDAGYSLIHF